jgi:hypothetical protein
MAVTARVPLNGSAARPPPRENAEQVAPARRLSRSAPSGAILPGFFRFPKRTKPPVVRAAALPFDQDRERPRVHACVDRDGRRYAGRGAPVPSGVSTVGSTCVLPGGSTQACGRDLLRSGNARSLQWRSHRPATRRPPAALPNRSWRAVAGRSRRRLRRPRMPTCRAGRTRPRITPVALLYRRGARPPGQ